MRGGTAGGAARMAAAGPPRGWMGVLVGADGRVAQVLFAPTAPNAPPRALRLPTVRLRALVG